MLATVALAFVTAVLAFFTYRLWSATKKLVESAGVVAGQQSTDMRESIRQSVRSADAMEKVAGSVAVSADAATASVATLKTVTATQSRAYLSVVGFNGFYQDRQAGYRFQVRPRLLNNGHTPAHNVAYWANAGILPVPLPENFAFPPPGFQKKHSAVLGPGQDFVLMSVPAELVDDSEIPLIKRGIERAVYTWGVVTYDDVFGQGHFTNFCHWLAWRQIANGEAIDIYYTEQHQQAN